MHVLARTDDRVHRAGLDALGAADAVGFHDPRDQWRRLFASATVIWLRSNAEYTRQRVCPGITTGRAVVDSGNARGHGFGVWAATVITALAALGLRQDAVEAFDQFG